MIPSAFRQQKEKIVEMSFQEKRKEFALLLALALLAALCFTAYFIHKTGSQSDKSKEEQTTENEEIDSQNENNKFYVDKDLTSEESTTSSNLEADDTASAVKDGKYPCITCGYFISM